MAVTPQRVDGDTRDPRVSVPIANGSPPAATAEAEPAELPLLPCSRSHGLRVVAPNQTSPQASAPTEVFATRTAPASSSLRTTSASSSRTWSRNGVAPQVVRAPFAESRSFAPYGIPWSGPRRSPDFSSVSARRASSSARSSVNSMTQWSDSSTERSRSSVRRVSSSLVISPSSRRRRSAARLAQWSSTPSSLSARQFASPAGWLSRGGSGAASRSSGRKRKAGGTSFASWSARIWRRLPSWPATLSRMSSISSGLNSSPARRAASRSSSSLSVISAASCARASRGNSVQAAALAAIWARNRRRSGRLGALMGLPAGWGMGGAPFNPPIRLLATFRAVGTPRLQPSGPIPRPRG